MFYRDKVLAALEAKRLELKRLDVAQYDLLQRLKEKQKQLESMSAADIREKLKGVKAPDALPTPEFDRAPGLRLWLRQPWDRNLASMRHWAAQTLENVTTCAVDGSQLPATKESPLPLAAVQVAWYVNSHTASGEFSKEASVKILTPDDLAGEEDVSEAGGGVALHRHEQEVTQVRKLMEQFAGDGESTLVFFDGSLAVSYSAGRRKEVRDRYRSAAVSMLRTSVECQVPLIAYIDRSRARDFTRMLCYLLDPDSSPLALLSDAAFLNEPHGAAWESWRSPAFICQRQDVVEEGNYTDHETGTSYSNEIYFTYLKINSGPPARLEFPAWLLRAGMLDRVIDWVRAEAIGGGGYPYAIQAADAAAVITFADRQRYLRALEEFGRYHDIRTMLASAKQASKERRRA